MVTFAYTYTHEIRHMALRTLTARNIIEKSGLGSQKQMLRVASVVVLAFLNQSGSDLDNF